MGYELLAFVALPMLIASSLATFLLRPYLRAIKELAALRKAVEEIKEDVSEYRMSRDLAYTPTGTVPRYIFEVTLETLDDDVAKLYSDFIWNHRPRRAAQEAEATQ